MKINIKRENTVTNNMLVEFSAAGIVQPYASGTFAGVVEDCRQITMLEEEEEVTYNICTLVVQGACKAYLSGTALQNGGDAFANGSSVSNTGTEKIGLIVPKPFPENGDYIDGELVNIVLL
jgi:hypothetical protein